MGNSVCCQNQNKSKFSEGGLADRNIRRGVYNQDKQKKVFDYP